MASEDLHTHVLDELFGRLKSAGFLVTVENVLDVQAFFLSTPVSELSLEELKYLLAPMIAKTSDEQQEVYTIVDKYIVEKSFVREEETAIAEVTTVPVEFYRLPEPRNIFEREPVLKMIILGITLVILLAMAGLVYLRNRRFNEMTVPVISTIDTTTAVDTLNKQSHDDSVHTKPHTVKDSTTPGFAIEGLHAFEPKEKNINAQLSIILGLIAGVAISFIVFRVKEEDYRTDDSNKKAALDSNSNLSNHSPLTEAASGRDLSILLTLRIADNNRLIASDGYMVAIKKNMLRLGTGTNYEFNIGKSIAGAVEKAGFQSPVFSFRKEQRRFLVLINETGTNKPVNSLFNYFIDDLIKAGVYVEKYSYLDSILALRGDRNTIVSLKELAYAKPGYSLIIFGEAKTIAGSGERARELLATWPGRMLITPRLHGDWSSAEYAMRKEGFLVVTAETYAVSAAVKIITGAQNSGRKDLLNPSEGVHALHDILFTRAEDVRKVLDDENLFQVVCATAIHPLLDWNLTIALYDAVIKNNGKKRDAAGYSDYNALLKIARFPFFNKNALPEALRTSLLRQLNRDTEVAARKALRRILQEAGANITDNAASRSHIEIQQKLHEFFLFAYDKKEFKEFEISKRKILATWKNLQDDIMKDHIASGNAKLLPAKTDGKYMTIEEFMVVEREKEVTRIGFLRVLTTIIPGLLIYLFLITFRPPFAYPKGSELYGNNPVTIIFKRDSCSAGVDSIKLSGNNVDSNFAVRGDSTVLDNMEYDIPVILKYNYRGLEKSASIDCTDSLYIVSIANCK